LREIVELKCLLQHDMKSEVVKQQRVIPTIINKNAFGYWHWQSRPSPDLGFAQVCLSGERRDLEAMRFCYFKSLPSRERQPALAGRKGLYKFLEELLLMVVDIRMKLADLPPLTAADHDRLAKLAARPESEIDLSDIPELTDDEWKTAVRGKHYRPVKTQITASLDKHVLAWLKADGRGYQTRMNAILRREMLQARSSGVRK
jgi:uncharacterized protein (DUF4415 family)